MKKLLVPMVITLLFSGLFLSHEKAYAAELTPEIHLRFQYFIPSGNDDYDSGFGTELQARLWKSKYFGYGFSAGMTKWDIKEKTINEYGSIFSTSLKKDGSVTMIPLGFSLFLKAYPHENLELIFEGGIRYFFIESDAEFSKEYSQYNQIISSEKHKADFDDGVAGVTALTSKLNITESVNFLCSFGYQFDIHKGDVTWNNSTIGENELESFFISSGIQLNF